jgi:hypothetical protein
MISSEAGEHVTELLSYAGQKLPREAIGGENLDIIDVFAL